MENNKVTVLSVTIKDKAALYSAYMGYLRNGGLFVPTKKQHTQGEKIKLSISLPEIENKIDILGTVAWITPIGAHSGSSAGIGVHFEGVTGKQLNEKIKKILGDKLDSGAQTSTM